MCLEKAASIPKKKTGIGYKLFRIKGHNITPEFAGNKPIPVGEWMKEKDRRPGLFDNGHSRCSGKLECGHIIPSYSTIPDYPAGFHILRYKKHALHYAKSKHIGDECYISIRKVQYRKVCFAGTITESVRTNNSEGSYFVHMDCAIVVAKEMKVLEESIV